jgi:hypothetical protein
MNNPDRQYLDLLSLFNYILGAIHLLFFIVFFNLWLSPLFQTSRLPPLHDLGQVSYSVIFSLVGLFLIYALPPLIFGSYAILTLISGRCLKRQRAYRFSFIVACLQCTSIPFGTILGIVTINILLRDSVRALYQANRR